jgi:uncharacterized protein YfaS (alpha-2-macroglobulin family)
MPVATRIIRIRDYNRAVLAINTTFNKESYVAGDDVEGSLSISRTDGVSLEDRPSYSLSVSFGNGSEFKLSDQTASRDGTDTFNFKIPDNTTQLSNTVAITVNYQDIT